MKKKNINLDIFLSNIQTKLDKHFIGDTQADIEQMLEDEILDKTAWQTRWKFYEPLEKSWYYYEK